MKFLKIAARDIASTFKNRFIRISVTAIIIVPLLYSLLYLAAFWDPYSRLNQMPVALVNLDQGSIREGQKVNYGKEIQDGLRDNKDLGFKFVSNLGEAKKGLEGKEYYAVFVIPEDFSKKISEVQEGKLEKPSIEYIANEKKNFLAAQINGKIASELKAKVIKSISEEFTKVTFNNLYDIKDGMKQAAEGSRKLSEGVGELKDKVPEMQEGVGKLYNGSTALDKGLKELQSNIPLMGEGIGNLKSKVDMVSKEIEKNTELKALMNLLDQPEKLKGMMDEASKLNDVDLNSLNSFIESQKVASEKFIASSIALNAHKEQLEMAIKSNPNLSPAEIKQLTEIVEGYSTLTTETSKNMKNSAVVMHEMSKNISKLGNMQKALKDNIAVIEGVKGALNDNNIAMAKALISSMPELRGGIDKLYSASNELIGGVNALADGSSQLNGGLKELNGKLPELVDGVTKLNDGSKELSEKLGDGSKELSDKLKVSSDEMGEFVSEPIILNENPINKVPNYGTGFAPYFIPLSLWVGALMMFFIITDKVDEDIDASPASVVLGKFLSYGYIGILQALLASVVVLMLGLKPANIPLYFLFNVFLSFVFIAIIQSLVFLLGQVGRLLAIVLLILQLTSSAGTFPLEVVPKFFKVLNPIMPFTYATGGLREIISGINYNFLLHNTIVLAATMIIFLIISVIMKGHADKVQKRIREKREAVA